MAGSLAGMVSTIVTYPTDLIKTRLTVQNLLEPSYRGIAHAFSTVYKQEGFLALYRGVSLTVLGILTSPGPVLFTYPPPTPCHRSSLPLPLFCRCSPVLCWLPSRLYEPGENLEGTPRSSCPNHLSGLYLFLSFVQTNK
uniref:Uncharacterized protein n=1 Tax=Suricata suricatta TaxID=37032 RepID=A0A673VLZ0_SURSU